MRKEIFKKIVGFPHYEISSYGRILSFRCATPKFLKPWKLHLKQYLYISLRKNDKTYKFRVHRLVLETFIGLCPEGMEGCHNDGNRTNNYINNLRWDTLSNNQKDRLKHGTDQRGSKNVLSKLKEDNIPEIFKMKKRGMTISEISKIFSVSYATISSVLRRINWHYIKIEGIGV